MQIAPNFTSMQWRKLNLDSNEDDWQTTIEVVNKRLNSRYIDPIDELLKSE